MGYFKLNEEVLSKINSAYEKALSVTNTDTECTTPVFANQHIHAKRVVIDDSELEEVGLEDGNNLSFYKDINDNDEDGGEY